jgi:hypothetical protein
MAPVELVAAIQQEQHAQHPQTNQRIEWLGGILGCVQMGVSFFGHGNSGLDDGKPIVPIEATKCVA